MALEEVGPVGRRRRRRVVALALTAGVVLVTFVLLVGWGLTSSEATPWRTVDVHGADLVVHYTGGECDRSATLEVEEGPDEVVVTVMVSGWALSCSDVGVPRELRTTLEAPVGGRMVVDGACREAKYAEHLACSGK